MCILCALVIIWSNSLFMKQLHLVPDVKVDQLMKLAWLHKVQLMLTKMEYTSSFYYQVKQVQANIVPGRILHYPLWLLYYIFLRNDNLMFQSFKIQGWKACASPCQVSIFWCMRSLSHIWSLLRLVDIFLHILSQLVMLLHQQAKLPLFQLYANSYIYLWDWPWWIVFQVVTWISRVH